MAMVHGVDGDYRGFPAGTPLPLKIAARACGVRVDRVRQASRTPEFIEAFKSALEASRKAEDPRSLAIAIRIRDDETAPAILRLQAIDRIERGLRPVSITPKGRLKRFHSKQMFPGYVVVLDPK